ELYSVIPASAQSCCCEKPNSYAQPASATESIKCFRVIDNLQFCTKTAAVVIDHSMKNQGPQGCDRNQDGSSLSPEVPILPNTTIIDSGKEIISGATRTSSDYLSELISHNCFAAECLMQ
ncbi:hypothetical protein L195_g041099, partial [Trifolium pratense]